MSKKYKIALTTIAILLSFTSIIGIGYLNYEPISESKEYAFVYVEGDLSFNFIDGEVIDTQEKEKSYHFSITNTSSSPYYYSLALNDVIGGSNAEYEVKSNQEGFQIISKEFPENDYTYLNTIKINGNETHSYTFTIKNPEEKQITGKLAIDLEKNMNTLANMILKNNEIKSEPKTALGEAANEEEGLIESSDELGTSYYFRGNVTNNYVSFAGMTWRIVKINGDGTVKLILNDLINNNTQFYKADNDFDLTFEKSNIYAELETWYQINLKNYDDLIANGKFCTDATSDEKGYATLTRIYTNKEPIFQCLGDNTAARIGLLTADEVTLAGASKNINNTKFYLYNSNIDGNWWTMSPAKNNNNTYTYIEVSKEGKLNEGTSGTLFRGSRPVINIIKKANVSGSGTESDPYIVNNL